MTTPSSRGGDDRQHLIEDNDAGCVACGSGDADIAPLLCCDGCDQWYHTTCVRPPVTDIPHGDWFCQRCRTTNDTKQQQQKVTASSTAATAPPTRAASLSTLQQQQPPSKVATTSAASASSVASPSLSMASIRADFAAIELKDTKQSSSSAAAPSAAADDTPSLTLVHAYLYARDGNTVITEFFGMAQSRDECELLVADQALNQVNDDDNIDPDGNGDEDAVTSPPAAPLVVTYYPMVPMIPLHIKADAIHTVYVMVTESSPKASALADSDDDELAPPPQWTLYIARVVDHSTEANAAPTTITAYHMTIPSDALVGLDDDEQVSSIRISDLPSRFYAVAPHIFPPPPSKKA